MIKSVAFAICMSLTLTAVADEKEVYNAFAVNMTGAGAQGRATTFQITINRWSTDEERGMLQKTLMEKGHDDFIKALRKQKETGFVMGHGPAARRNPFPSTRLHYAYQTVKDGKREITLVTDRPIGMREAASASRSVDYDTSMIVMEVPADDVPGDDKKTKGTGSMYVALKVGVDKKTGKLKVEMWGNEPVRLTDVEREK